MKLLHIFQAPPPGSSPMWDALGDAVVVFGFSLFSALVTLNAADVRTDPWVALYGPITGAGLAFFISLRTTLAKKASDPQE